MAIRKGLGAGKGSGYRNIIPHDRPVHQQSTRGIKQPQRINIPMARGGKKFDVYADYHIHDKDTFDTLEDARESAREYIDMWNQREEKVKTEIVKKGNKYVLTRYFKNKEKIVGGDDQRDKEVYLRSLGDAKDRQAKWEHEHRFLGSGFHGADDDEDEDDN